MKYRFPLLFLVLILVCQQSSFAGWSRFDKKPGFFGFTRACIEDWERVNEAVGGCVSSFIPLLFMDSFTAPVLSMIKITDRMEKPDTEPSSSQKLSSDSSSTKKKDQAPEIPEERKLMNRLSLFMHVSDDARNYLVTQTSTPLLDSAVAAIRHLGSNANMSNTDLTLESETLLQIESEILHALYNANGGEQ